MSLLRSVLLAFIFFTLSIQSSWSQISSTSGVVNKCVPASITYTAPAGATNILWTFSGIGTSTNATGSFNILNPTNFNAVFTGIVAGNPVTFTVPVNVHANPVANFNITQPAADCAVKTVTFVDLSSTTGSLVSWQWIYGTGASTTMNTGGTHPFSYSVAGTYSVTLKVTDANGCEHLVTKGPIVVTDPPVAVISADPPLLSSCAASLTASFSASNSIGTNLSYNWNLGNSQTAQSQNVGPITYTSQINQYLITLTVTSGGCSAVTSTAVTVSNASLAITVPSVLCVGISPLATINTNQPTSMWDLGNSNVQMHITPVPPSPPTLTLAPYMSPGTYTIKVNAGSPPCVAPTASAVVSVQQVTAAFVGTPISTCGSSLVTTFTNQSAPSPLQYTWTVQSYSSVATLTSTSTNPTFTFTQNHPSPYHVYKTPYVPVIHLLVRSAAGCTASTTHTFQTIARATARFDLDKKEGCVPLSVRFNDTSYIPPYSPFMVPASVAGYTWNFGVTPPVTVASAVTGTIPSVSFTYTQPGVYTPTLTIKTTSGCTESFTETITVVNPPQISFAVSPGTVCPDVPVQITNTSPNQAQVQHWHVQSDNGFFSGCVSDPNPSWKFTNVGVHTFTMSAYRNSCMSSSVSTQSVLVKGPIVKARFATDCNNRRVVTFSLNLQEVQTASVNFGDGTQIFTVTGLPAPGGTLSTVFQHTYATTGNYTVLVEGINPATSCSNSTVSMVVNVRDVQASIVLPNTACSDVNAIFNGSGSIDVNVGCNRGYTWFVDNLPPFETETSTTNYTFTSTGVHTISLRVTDVNGCQSVTSGTLRVSDVTPAFSVHSNSICLSSGTLQITNNTLPVTDPIANYSWNFGNGSTLNTTLQSVPVQTYALAFVPFSTYIISLTAANTVGCVRTATQSIQVILPQVDFSPVFDPGKVAFCVNGNSPTTVTFSALQSYPNYTYNFGGVPAQTLATTSQVITYTFNTAGTHTVVMRAKTAEGCENSATRFVVGAITPTADFVFKSDGSESPNAICAGQLISFTNTSLPEPYFSTWNIGGSVYTGSVIIPNPISVSSNTTIPVTLTVTTGQPAFCTASITKSVNVYVLKADIVLSKTVVCLGESIKLSLSPTPGDTMGVNAWVWDFGDSSPSPTVYVHATPGPPKDTLHTYINFTATANGQTSVSLIYWSADMACKGAVAREIKIIKIDPDFKRNNELMPADSAHCIEIPDDFTNLTTSNSSGLTYTWSFGDGNTSNSENVQHIYLNPGTFPVTLTAEDIHQCKESSVKNMTIYSLPSATIDPGEDCPNQQFTITAQTSPGVVSGTWSPASGIVGSSSFTTNSTNLSVSAILPSSEVYTLVVQDVHGCVSKGDTASHMIVQPLAPIRWDTAVVVGQPIPIHVIAPEVTYTWTPITANLSCTNCLNPISNSTVDIIYTIAMEDTLKCSIITNTYNIHILPATSIDVPSAFTPNGDGVNDIIYPNGWGITKLEYFRVFNRWGQLMFESNDISVGWDGTYNGVPQNMDTYVYQVSVETYLNQEPLKKTGTFKLLR